METVIGSEEDLRSRFRRAATELFRDHGYDRTTTGQIARRVGVTERTFYRYYPDKRDVLFEGEAAVRSLLAAAITSAPAELGPFDTIHRALRVFQSVLEAFRTFAETRHRIMEASPALVERQAMRTVALIELMAAMLVSRGVPPLAAELAARAGMTAFMQASITWLNTPDGDLGAQIERAFSETKTLLLEARNL